MHLNSPTMPWFRNQTAKSQNVNPLHNGYFLWCW